VGVELTPPNPHPSLPTARGKEKLDVTREPGQLAPPGRGRVRVGVGRKLPNPCVPAAAWKELSAPA
jgi:hypothetical protein